MSEKKPKIADTEMQKLENQFEAFDQNVKDLTHDRMNSAPKENTEPQTKLSSKDLENSKDLYLKPKRVIFSKEKFNEKFRDDYNFAKEYVKFVAEHKEIPGETIQSIWTKPFPGVAAEEWDIPVNKPIWGPRYLAEQLTKCKYHRLKMDQKVFTGGDDKGQYYGQMAVDTVVQRLDAIPVSSHKSIFMGAGK
jgi:hypothetical protein